jgi:hypothetical protein
MDTIFIMRVGDINVNFKVSVLDRMHNNTKQPVWGYNKKSIRNISQLLCDKVASGDAYVLFLPSGASGFCGLAKITSIVERQLGPFIALDETDEEIGWKQTHNNSGWDIEVRIGEYWNFSSFKDTVFGHKTIRDKQILSQSSVHRLSEHNMKELFAYLIDHVKYIVGNIKPTYSYNPLSNIIDRQAPLNAME